jgi:hypothetical protein
MSYDLLLKNTKRNWARGACCAPSSATAKLTAASTAAAPTPPTLEELRPTADEQKSLAQIRAVKAAAQRGDKRAIKQWAKAPKYIARLRAKAIKGDKKAQRKLAILRASKIFAPESGIGRRYARGGIMGKDEILGAYPTQILGAHPTQILGADINDDELAIAKDGGQCERDSLSRLRGQYPQYPYQQSQYQGQRQKVRRLKDIVRRSVRGDTAAQAQLSQIQANLTTRANAGDARATKVLNKISQWQTKFQAQYGITPSTVTPPTAAPASYTYPAQASYPAPAPYYPGSTPGDMESELDASDPEL